MQMLLQSHMYTYGFTFNAHFGPTEILEVSS